MPWHSGRTLFALAAAFAATWPASGAALAQGPAYVRGPVLRPPLIDRPLTDPPPVNAPIITPADPQPSAVWHAPEWLPGPDLPAATVPVERPFWVVSTRECRQADCPQCAGGDMGYFCVTAGAEPRRSTADAFRAGLVPGVPVCVIVHGSALSWEGLLKAAPRVMDWIASATPGRAVQFVFFTWPSEDVNLALAPIDLAIRGMQASFNGLYLARFIQTLPPTTPVGIVGHSHGTRVAASALHLLDGGTVNRLRLAAPDAPARRIRVVFLASAIDRHWLAPDQRYGRAMHHVERLLNVVNRDDFALALYPFRKPFSNTALGYTGIGRAGFARLGPLASRYGEFDVTSLLRRGHDWHVYYKEPEVARVVAPLVTFADGPEPLPADSEFRGPAPAATIKSMELRPADGSPMDTSTSQHWPGSERF